MIGEGETFYQFVGEKVDAPDDNLARNSAQKRDEQVQ